MSRPVPSFSDESRDQSTLKPFFAEWLGQTTQTLTAWQMLPKFVAQILEYKIDSDSNEVYVKLREALKIWKTEFNCFNVTVYKLCCLDKLI